MEQLRQPYRLWTSVGYSLAGTTITSIEGILNRTSNYILSSMFENSLSFEKALEHVQEKGIAESNSILDIKGIDSGCKLLLLVNRLLDCCFNLQDVSIEGIDYLTKEDILQVKVCEITKNTRSIT